jgi:predicted AAA+ superfamily ATPase
VAAQCFPDSFPATNDRASLRWRQDFICTYLERDIPQLGPRILAETLRRFWTGGDPKQFATALGIVI